MSDLAESKSKNELSDDKELSNAIVAPLPGRWVRSIRWIEKHPAVSTMVGAIVLSAMGFLQQGFLRMLDDSTISKEDALRGNIAWEAVDDAIDSTIDPVELTIALKEAEQVSSELDYFPKGSMDIVTEARGRIGELYENVYKLAYTEMIESGARILEAGIQGGERNMLESGRKIIEAAVELQEYEPRGHYFLAIAYMELDDFTSAESSFRESNRLDSKDYLCLIGWANCLLELKEYEDAKKAIDSAITLAPKGDGAPYEIQGRYYYLQDKNDTKGLARAAFQNGVGENPQDDYLRLKYGLFLGLILKAHADANVQLGLVGESAPAWIRASARFHMGKFSLELGDEHNEAALDFFKQASVLDPYDLDAIIEYFHLNDKMGLTPDPAVLEAVRRVGFEAERDWAFWSNYGSLLAEVGLVEEALLKFAQAYFMNSKTGTVVYNYAKLLRETGRFTRSHEILQRFEPYAKSKYDFNSHWGHLHANLLFNPSRVPPECKEPRCLSCGEVVKESLEFCLSIKPHDQGMRELLYNCLGKIGDFQGIVDELPGDQSIEDLTPGAKRVFQIAKERI